MPYNNEANIDLSAPPSRMFPGQAHLRAKLRLPSVILCIGFVLPTFPHHLPDPAELSPHDELCLVPEDSIPLWAISEQPDLVVGMMDGAAEYLFSNIIHAHLLGDGTIVTALYQSGYFELRYFDRKGKYLASAGRYGQGPFEVSGFGLSLMTPLPGDSVLVVGRDARFHIFGPRGEPVRSGRLPLKAMHLRAGLADADHLLVEFSRQTPPTSDGTFIPENRFELLDIRTGIRTDLAVLPGEVRTEFESLAFEMPFGPLPFFAAGAGSVWFGHSSSPVVSGRKVEGVDDGIVVSPAFARQAVTRRSESLYKTFIEGFRGQAEAARVRRYSRSIASPDSMPWYSMLLVDDEGSLWVREYQPRWSTEDYRWCVYDQMGQLVARASMPFEALADITRSAPFGGWIRSVAHIGDQEMLTIHRDGLGVQRIHRFRIEKAVPGVGRSPIARK